MRIVAVRERTIELSSATRNSSISFDAMTASVIADSIVNLCGAIGLCAAMAALYRRDPKGPLTRRLLFMLGVAADTISRTRSPMPGRPPVTRPTPLCVRVTR